MKRPVVHQVILLLCAGLLLVGIPAQAQNPNLLTNPGFEAPFSTLDGEPPREVAQGWIPWHVPAPPGAPSYLNRQPEYYPTAPDTDRIRSGSDAQQILSFFAVHTGGVFQRVTGITPGATLRFSVYAYIWSTTFEEPDISEDDGDVIVDVGIDPTGGTDGQSPNIVWSSSVETPDSYDAYKEYSIEVQASGGAVTVFVRTTAGVPVKHNNIYLDDASLVAAGQATAVPATATLTSTPRSTNTSAPSATSTFTPTNTATSTLPPTVGIISTATPEGLPLPATETSTPTNTSEPPTNTPTTTPSNTPTNTLTATVTLTNTSAPTNTSTNTAVPTVAATNTPIPTDTATPTQEIAPASPTPLVPTNTPTSTSTKPPINETFPGTILHTVRSGDTVAKLAERYNSTIEAIVDANGLGSNYLIVVGQGLIIPVRITAATPTPSATPMVIVVTATPLGDAVPPIGSGNTYTVQPGDSLSRISRLFNTTVAALAQLNGIVNPNQIQVGQQLTIPGIPQPTEQPLPEVTQEPVPQMQLYRVQFGDTLSRISLRFGVPIATIAQANGIRQWNLIFVGQILVIP